MKESIKQKIVVVDIGNPGLDGNKMFIPAEAIKVSHTILPICLMHDELTKLGYKVVTPDIYFSMDKANSSTALISFLTSSRTKALLQSGAMPLVLVCLESPFIASRFFTFLGSITSKFKHSFLFLGMKKRTSRKTQFHRVYFPQYVEPVNFKEIAFADKQLLTMISSCKMKIRNFKIALIKLLYGFGVKDVYAERVKAINYLAAKKTFDLYGRGWDEATGDEQFIENVKKCYQGTVATKYDVMGNYKFALCFENTIFPGYVTEKIFDAMFAGVVPVYLGAPDINKVIPPDVYINFADYSGWDSLYSFLENMTEAEHLAYQNNIKNFLKSDKFKFFSAEYFSESIVSLVKSAIG